MRPWTRSSVAVHGVVSRGNCPGFELKPRWRPGTVTLAAICCGAFLLLSLLAGCGGGSGDSGVVSGTGTILGLARNQEESLEGATVRIFSGGTEQALTRACTVGHGGAFAATVSSLRPGEAFTVQVTTVAGQAYRTRVPAFSDKCFVFVNALTTLCDTYLAAHPEVSLAEARRRVHGFLGIPAKAEMGDQVASRRFARFSCSEFALLGRQNPAGWQAFLEERAQAAHDWASDPANREVLLAYEPGYENPTNWWEDMEYEGHENNPVFDDVAEEIVCTADQGIKVTETVAKDVEGAFNLGHELGAGLIDNLIHIGINFIPGIGDKPDIADILTELGNITDQLNTIQSTLEAIEAQIASLSDQVTQAEYSGISTTLNNGAVALITSTSGGSAAYNQLIDAFTQFYNDGNQPDPLSTQTASNDLGTLMSGNTLASINTAAGLIHTDQFNPPPGQDSLMGLARSIYKADLFLSTASVGNFENQVNYYATLQSQAAHVLQALAAPYVLPTGLANFIVEEGTGASPASRQNQANGFIKTIHDNIQHQLCAFPYGPPTDDVVYAIQDKTVFSAASVDLGDSATNWSYANSFKSGGVSTWSVADTTSINNCLVNRVTKKGWCNALNAAGFALKPGKVTYEAGHRGGMSDSWTSDGTKTACANGFLTIKTEKTSDYGGGWYVTLGWIDADDGTTGTLGDQFLEATWGDIGWLMTQDICTWSGRTSMGKFHGPILLMGNPQNTGSNTIAPVAYGLYNGFTFQQGQVQFDPHSNNTSALQALGVFPISTQAKIDLSQYGINNAVYFSVDSKSVGYATISNVVRPPSDQWNNDNDTPSGPELPSSNFAGMIHWLPGSAGKSVTFTATRYLPDWTKVSSSIAITSPVSAGSAAPDAIQVWPTTYTIYSDDFKNTAAAGGVKLYVARHLARGAFEDATGSAGLTYACTTDAYPAGDPRISLDSQGVWRATEPLPDGTVVTVTITDTTVPVATDTRPTATSTITVITPP